MKKSSRYPKIKTKLLTENTSKNIQKTIIECSSCKKPLLFFSYLTNKDFSESVWYCNKKGCNEYKKFKY